MAGIPLSHAERVLSPLPLNKLQLARYYASVAPWLLPHVSDRPLTLVRWAEGKQTEKGGVYLRHRRAWGPDALRRVEIPERHKLGQYLVADDLAAVIALVQMDILEIHTWNSRSSHVERPDRIVFDLDPGPNVSFGDLVHAAKDFRALLTSIGVDCWVKTTGGKGLHLVVPLEPAYDWATCLEFARILARHAAASDGRFTASMPKAQRTNKILIDYLRNNRGNTSVSAYSTRANAEATVSTPIAWDELTPRLRPERFTVHSVPRLLRQRGADPWAGYWSAKQRLPVGQSST